MNLIHRLPPETTRSLLRFLSGLVPSGQASGFHCFLCACVFVRLWVCVHLTQMYSCPVVQLHTDPSQLFPIISGCHRKESPLTHPTHTHIQRATYGQVWLIHPSTQMLVINLLWSIVQVCSYFLSNNNTLIVLSDHQGPGSRESGQQLKGHPL